MSALTLEMIEEAGALIKALSPKPAPDDINMMAGISGLKIMRNKALPHNMIVVSEDLFNKIFDAESMEKED